MIIRIENLSKKYSGKVALDIDNLSIQPGERFGLVGNNGAGKTTLFSLLLDLIRPTSGVVWSKDTAVSDSDTWKN